MPNTSRGHRKSTSIRVGARRAVVLAVAFPVAATVAVGQGTAFATENPTRAAGAATAHRALDSADELIAKNLDARVLDPRLAGSTLSGVVVDAA